MRIEHREHGIDVYVRQSWIGDALMCNERGRNNILRPEWSMPNDATILGTAVHAGIASVLLGEGNAREVAHEELQRLLSEPFQRVKYTDHELFNYANDLCDEWEKSIAPTLGKVTGVEEPFHFEFDKFEINGTPVTVYGKGTIDCVTETDIWDWKTSARKYSARDKQSQAVQPTMYSAAMVAKGTHEYPVTFKYGVLVRGGKGQIVPVHRNESHTDWLKEQVRPLVRTALLIGTDESWTKNDTHYLCSQTWCSYWSVCKGSKLSPADIIPKEQS
jgi:hypothetical protein